jgi:hypothetical protein
MCTKLKKIEIRRVLITGIFILILSNGLFAQSLKKTFNYIEKGEVEKADLETGKFTEEIKKSGVDFTLYGIASCLIAINEGYHNYNPYKSLEMFEITSKINANKSEVNKFLEKYNLSIEKVHELIFQTILKEAKKVNTEESYQKALEVCQECFFKAEVLKLKEDAAYNNAKGDNSILTYEKFISSYPNSQYINEIKILSEKFAFEHAKFNLSLSSLNYYINKYSNNANIYIPIAIHLRDSILDVEESQRKEKAKLKPDILKSAIIASQNNYYKYVGIYGNRYFYSFPMKYYNGNQLFFQSLERDDLSPYVVNDNNELVKLNTCSEYGQETDRGSSFDSRVYITAIGTSNKTERFSFYSPYTLPNINSSYFQQVGYGISSYDQKASIITKTFSLAIEKTQGYSQYVGAKLIPYNIIFKEAPDIKDEDVDILFSTRLSNNDILIILKAKIEYLSGQLNRMFGIDGANKISRTFETAAYFKFIVISEDGSMLKSNRNYLLPMTFIRPIDNGFIIMSVIGKVISLDEKDFGRKSFVYSQTAGKNILVTEGINFDANLELENGIEIFKFNNSADLVKEIVVDKPSDANIGRPYPIYIQHSENYLCLFYLSFDQKIVNDCVYAFKLFDFDLNLKSTYIGEKPDVGGIPIRVLGDGNHGIPADFGYITSKDDIFYISNGGKLYTIPFK